MVRSCHWRICFLEFPKHFKEPTNWKCPLIRQYFPLDPIWCSPVMQLKSCHVGQHRLTVFYGSLYSSVTNCLQQDSFSVVWDLQAWSQNICHNKLHQVPRQKWLWESPMLDGWLVLGSLAAMPAQYYKRCLLFEASSTLFSYCLTCDFHPYTPQSGTMQMV